MAGALYLDRRSRRQTMQQDGRLSYRGDDGAFLPVLSTTLGQFQAPTPQVAILRTYIRLTTRYKTDETIPATHVCHSNTVRFR